MEGNQGSVQDFEMGGSSDVKINHYQNQKQTDTTPEKSTVDPLQGSPVLNQEKKTDDKGPKELKKKPNNAKLGLGCLGAFFSFLFVFLILALIFIGQSSDEGNSIATFLGLNPASFVSGLITFVHVTFLLFAIAFFIFTAVGFFRVNMVKKEDKVAKKKALKMGSISGICLIFWVIIWILVGTYLTDKAPNDPNNIPLAPIITDPAETLQLTAPIDIRFDASNVPVDRTTYSIVQTEWDFGDGNKATGQIVSHRFEKIGEYTVTLKVRTRDKQSNEVSVGYEGGVLVSVSNQALSADFLATPQKGEVPLTVKFDASGSIDPDDTIETYEWDLDEDGEFDDGDEVEVEYEFTKVGRFEVALRVSNKVGEFDVVKKIIQVDPADLPEAVITVDNDTEEFETGVSYLFSAEDSSSPAGDIKGYTWDFGDGKTYTTKNLSYTFDTPGEYLISLKVTDEEDKEGETELELQVKGPEGVPRALIVSDPQSNESGVVEGQVPLSVLFDARGSTDPDNNITDYKWDFDADGEYDKFGPLISHTFTEAGNYTVNLLVEDGDGNKDTSSINVIVKTQGIEAKLSADKVEGEAPLVVNFDASASSFSDGKITSYQWNFDDGTEPRVGISNITYKFDNVGTYDVELTAVGDDGSTATDNILVTVRGIPLQACFEAVFEDGAAPLENSFDPSCSSGAVAKYLWDFGDGNTSTEVKPEYIFEEAGTYEVTLEIEDSGNIISTFSKTITVN
jgi:PKD repeat protein